MKTVVIAGATGYLGGCLVARYLKEGWHVRALVRDRTRAERLELGAAELVEAQVTEPETLKGVFDDANLVVSSLGITRQRDGLTYQDVDFQGNANLLDAALAAGVPHFAYVHVIGAERMKGVALVDAKQAFVDRLQAAPIQSTIIAPCGFFSDMRDFLEMARGGRVWLFGDGSLKLNPIHGEDLAEAVHTAVEYKRPLIEVGGPDTFTHEELAELAFSVLGKPEKITHLPDILRRAAIKVLPWVTPATIHGPATFFLTAMGVDMVGTQTGTHHLKSFFEEIA
ncbi:SDR family oxidoreductase [Pseudovibrio exalbescens]|uniref:3-beta hydroxysteroid dehydrogenase n=1 Tax=Pseudovibrio exalbescens TaxID=197461 RepID=A0A1U7JE21_9HYPH|nr:SDR family oxidoreductase [Pseudovibrio exalbescens]OKL42983.1 3-beta hydroxysteroid dehydrogenase [Pseudovibrio exalbescens]